MALHVRVMSPLLVRQLAQGLADTIRLIVIRLLHTGHQILVLHLLLGDVSDEPPLPQQDGTGQESLDLLQQMGGEDHRLVIRQQAQHHPVEVLPVEEVAAGEGFVHEDVVRPL